VDSATAKERQIWVSTKFEKLFSQSLGKASRYRLITEAVTAHGYSQMEMASFLSLHYSTISRILTANKSANLKTP
jgi:hypothetical protein